MHQQIENEKYEEEKKSEKKQKISNVGKRAACEYVVTKLLEIFMIALDLQM